MMPATESNRAGLDFLSSAGEMGRIIEAFDWSGHPLGDPAHWPQSLKTSVSLILNSRHPMWIGWGLQMSFLYNDAYFHVLGPAKHPWALGRPASEVWAEIWDVCGPLADKVFREGQASFVDDVRLFMNRGSFLEETYYSFSYSPIRDESGKVGGLFCPSTDVSLKVIGARRLRTLSELAANALVERTTKAASTTAMATLAKNPDDVPFALLYIAEKDATVATLQATASLRDPGEEVAPANIDIAQSDGGRGPWPIAEVLSQSQTRLVSVERLKVLPPGLAGRPVTEALVVPVAPNMAGNPVGALVAGISPTRKLDSDYRAFFELVATHIGSAIQNARVAEEERKRAEALAELDRAKTQFFSNISHEFRTPLTLMLGPLESVLSKDGVISSAARDELDTARRNSLRLLKLVNSLLDFSRIEAGRLKAAFEPVDLARLTNDLASNFRSAMEYAGLRFTVDCVPLPDPVYVDRDMWEKIVLNLLSNALKFTLEGGVSMRVEARNGAAVLTVSDTGVGIPESELPHIFERFHRVEGSRGRTYEGSGIGLALIQELVKLHGGTVEASSHASEGSRFTVTIPYGCAHLPPEQIKPASGTSAESPASHAAYTREALTWIVPDRSVPQGEGHLASKAEAGPRERILLADDNADMRDYVYNILGDKYDLVTVTDGQAALEEARRTRPDLILSDVMMPKVDGFGLLSALRDDPQMVNVPFIMFSARAGEEARSEGMGAGADDYLIKPFSARELVTRVAAHLKLASARREATERERVARDEAEALNKVSSVLGSELDLQKLVQAITDITTKLTSAKFGAFFYNVLNEQGEAYLLCALSGAPREDFEKFGMPRNTPVFHPTFSGSGSRRSDDIRKDPDYGKCPPHFGMPNGHLPVCSYLAVPVKSRSGEVLGGLFFGHPEPAIFTEASERLAIGIASHAAIAIDNARLYQKAEQQARASLLLAAIVGSSDDAIISKDLDGVITSWNKSAERLFGYTAQEAIGKTVAELLIPEDRQDEEPRILARLRNGERVDHFETVRRSKDGRLLDVSLTISPVKDAQGHVIGASKIARDISPQIKARAAIETLNGQLRSELDAMTRLQKLSTRTDLGDFTALIAEIVDVAVEVTGADMGNIQLLESGALKIAAHRGFESGFLDFFNRVDDSHSAYGSAMKTGERVVIENIESSPIFAGTEALSVMLRAGARAVQSTPLVARSGELIGMLSTHYRTIRRPSERDLSFLDILARQTADIIERQRAERALRTSEERLRMAQKAAKIGAFEWNIQSGVNTWSSDLEELYGLQPGSFPGTKTAWEDLIHPEDREIALKKVEEAFKTGMPMEAEWRVIWPDRSVHWLAGRFQVHSDARGTPVRMTGVNFEITERKMMENDLRRANQDLEQFAYSASHDLQEPLRSVKIFSELLAGRYSGKLNDEALQFLNNVRDGARRMEMLVRDLLVYTQASTVQGEPNYVDATAAIQAAIANLAGAIAETGAAVDFEPLPSVRIHHIQLQQVFQNLIGNAIKYHRPGVPPVVHTTVRRDDGNWVFAVSDNGIGIEAQFKERIFGLFKRLHTGDEYSGTGIGLALCRRIVERHHGRIWVESEPGKGSTFQFTLPA